MQSSNTPTKRRLSSKTYVIIILVVAAIATTAWLLARDYAKEVARPLEQALISEGAKKLCESGDTGRSPDNDEPWYSAYYTLEKTREQTESLLFKITEQNQFRLTHASPTNKGHLSVDDAYIDHWYFDNANKVSPYSDLEAGRINLAFAFYNDHESAPVTACENNDSPTLVDSTHTFIRISIRLPIYKK